MVDIVKSCKLTHDLGAFALTCTTKMDSRRCPEPVHPSLGRRKTRSRTTRLEGVTSCPITLCHLEKHPLIYSEYNTDLVSPHEYSKPLRLLLTLSTTLRLTQTADGKNDFPYHNRNCPRMVW